MRKIPVLFLLSSDVDLKIFNSSPRLMNYQFYSLAATLYLYSSLYKKPEQRLKINLIKKIDEVKPAYLIIHLGLAFERYSTEFLLAILDATDLYPKLKIGIDMTFEYIVRTIDNLDASPEKKELLKRLKKSSLSFVMEPEAMFLAGLLR